MATDEEYLDNLLKSMTDNAPSRPRGEAFEGYDSFEGTENMSDLNDMNDLSGSDMLFGDNTLSEDDVFSARDTASSSDDEWMNDLSKLMAQEDQGDIPQTMEEIDKINFENLIDKLGDGDDELDEINGLLMHAEQDGAVDDDMLALLEGIDNSKEQEDTLDVFNALDELTDEDASEAIEEQDEESIAEELLKEKPPKKEKKKRAKKEKVKKEKPEKKRWFFGRKKRGEQIEDEEAEIQKEMVVPFEVAESVIEREKKAAEEAQEMEGVTEEEPIGETGGQPEAEAEEMEAEAVPEVEAGGNTEETQKPKEKKQGFLARLITALTSDGQEAENISEENKEILNELSEEDEQIKEKKKKGKKEKKEKKDKKEEKKKPPKKPKKSKEEKAKDKEKDAPEERRGKPISTKMILVLVAFCATILGSIILLSFFLPEYADKMSARDAFRAGDYEAVYTLLYDKKLTSNDELIFNRAKTIRIIERRVDAYKNRLALGKELEALDSLLKGVACYQTLTEADEYGVRQEVNAIYQQICSILENNYGITADEAMEINAYESEVYTRRLQSIVYGIFPGSLDTEPVESAQPQPTEDVLPEEISPEDILPEEEEIMGN